MVLPDNRVVMATASVSTAKWTTARLASVRLAGSRSVRYWAMACSMDCAVSGFFNSAVATGNPLMNKARSRVLALPAS